MSKFEDKTFTLVVKMERRPPAGFTAVITDPSIPKEKDTAKAKTKSKAKAK